MMQNEKKFKRSIDRGTWKVVTQDSVSKNANILGGRFVLAIKYEGTRKEVWKARSVVQGYRDHLKKSLVHDTAVSRQQSSRLLVGLSASFGFSLFSTDVTQAYLQSSENLVRDFYIKSTKELSLAPGQMLKLLRPLYGLADRGDYLKRTLSNHLRRDMGMKSTTGDPALFFKRNGDKHIGLCAAYVDDILQDGDPSFVNLSEQTLDKFQCHPREWNDVQFGGVEIESKIQEIVIHQRRYISKLKPLKNDATFSDFKSFRAKLSWVTQTCPFISCTVALAAQITANSFQVSPTDCVKQLNRALSHVNKVPDLAVRFHRLDLETLSLRVYSDASYENNADGSSQLGYIIFLTDATGRCQPIFWSSHKSRRVTRSVLGSETMALADAFDMANALKHDNEMIMK
jgi:Reverse transcriptase (RNA-dependent DNA polymerase)